MSLSRRSFLRRSAAVVATAPVVQHLSYDFVRPGTTWKMPRHMRISFGLPEQNRAAVEAIKKVTGKG